MARPLRVEYPGALYHVISRGNDKKDLFLSDCDRNKFLCWLEDAVQHHNLICHAYCLMNNHYHLLLETREANLSKAMRDLNGNYTGWFNHKHNRSGHLFQGRYKAYVIEKELYLLEVARYIVLNPVRAGLIDHPRFWKWSSYNATASNKSVPNFLCVDWLLKIFSSTKQRAIVEYRNFVKDGMEKSDLYDNLEHGFLLGSPQFIHAIWEKTNGSEEIKSYPREQRIVGRPSLQEIFCDIKNKKDRNQAIVFARTRCGYFPSEIAIYVDLDPSVVGKISREVYNKRSKIID